MTELAILSPHRDDAVFSLGLSLTHWSRSATRVRIVNFFTVSNYAPRANTRCEDEISVVREREDRRTLRLISRTIDLRDAHLLDAPLRLGIGWQSVSTPDAAVRVQTDELKILTALAGKFVRGCEFVLAPLGLGDHIDHLQVKRAALAALSRAQLGFYEDLPYATWTTKARIDEKVREAETSTRAALRPAIVRQQNAISYKRRLVARYGSQIGREDAEAIARYSAKYGGGERLWIPNHIGEWRRFLA